MEKLKDFGEYLMKNFFIKMILKIGMILKLNLKNIWNTITKKDLIDELIR